jgi:hypothetical protein
LPQTTEPASDGTAAMPTVGVNVFELQLKAGVAVECKWKVESQRLVAIF